MAATARRGASGRGAARTRQGGRDQRVDALRGLALMSMFVAHCAPSAGPLRLFNLSEFLTAPLFALLIGIGAQLGDRGARGLPAAFVRAGVRAAILVALSVWLTSLGAQIDIVLMYLALPTLLAPLLARMPSAVLALVACASWAAAPTLQKAFVTDTMRAFADGDRLGYHLWQVTFTGGHYRLTGLLIFTCLGLLIQRFTARPARSWHPVLVGMVALAVAALMLVAKSRLGFEPYDGSHLELFFDALLAGGVALTWLGTVTARAQLTPLAVCGAMTLSVYTLQIMYLAWYVRSYAPGKTDDSWVNVAVLCVGALVLPMLWRSLVSKQPWQRGPIEGPTAAVTGIFR